MPSPAWFLSHSAHTRYTTGALAYFAQGIPMGLLHIALPAWLSTQGVPAIQIATSLIQNRVFRSQSCLVAEGQPDRDGHHVFRRTGGRLWPCTDAHRRRASIQFHDASMGHLNAVMGLAGAFLALALGPMIDRFGAKRMLTLTIFVVGLHAFLLAGSQQLWNNSTYVQIMMAAWILLLPVTMVCVLALAMSICSHATSATQFAIYMSISNLGAAGGSMVYGFLADYTSWSQNYALKGFMVFILLLIILLFRSHGHPEELLEEEPA